MRRNERGSERRRENETTKKRKKDASRLLWRKIEVEQNPPIRGGKNLIVKFDREIVIGKEIKLGSCLKIIFASRLNTVTIIYETVR